MEVDNPLGAQPGDRVWLSLPGTSILGATATLYALPAVSLVLGALAGTWAAPALGWSPDTSAMALSALGLVSGLGLARLVGRRLGARASYRPRMVDGAFPPIPSPPTRPPMLLSAESQGEPAAGGPPPRPDPPGYARRAS